MTLPVTGRILRAVIHRFPGSRGWLVFGGHAIPTLPPSLPERCPRPMCGGLLRRPVREGTLTYQHCTTCGERVTRRDNRREWRRRKEATGGH